MSEPADRVRGDFAQIKHDMGSHITNVRITAQLEAAQLYRRKALNHAERDMVIRTIARDLVDPYADVRKNAKDALRHAFDATRIYGSLSSSLGQTDLANLIEIAMEGLRSPIEEIPAACRFFIGKMIDECMIHKLRELEMALLVGHKKILGKYGTDRSIEWWKPEIEMRRREIYCGISGEDCGIRRAQRKRRGEERSHLRIVRTG